MYNLNQYIHQKSPVHNRDPRVKIIGVLVMSLLILKVSTIGLLIAAFLSMAAALVARIPVMRLVGALRPVLPLFLILFVLYILFTPGQPLPMLPIGPITITYQGLYLGAVQVGRFMLLVMAASILTMTTTQSEINVGLERLLRPLKLVGLSSHDIAMMLSLALRFIPLLAEDMKNVSAAQLARGANINPRRLSGKIRAIGYLARPLSISIFRRCDQLVDAMEARGYRQGPRTYLYEPKLTTADWGLIAIIISLLIAVLSGQ